MKKLMIMLVTVIALSAPAAVYASQISENLRQEKEAAREYVVNNHEYKQQLWLDSAEENHSNTTESRDVTYETKTEAEQQKKAAG